MAARTGFGIMGNKSVCSLKDVGLDKALMRSR